MTRALCAALRQALLLLTTAAALTTGTTGAPSPAPVRWESGGGGGVGAACGWARGWARRCCEHLDFPEWEALEWEEPVGLRGLGIGRSVGTSDGW